MHANAWAPTDWDYIHGRADAVRSLHATRRRITFCGHMHEPQLYHLSRDRQGRRLPAHARAWPIPLLPQPALAGDSGLGRPAARRRSGGLLRRATTTPAATLTYWRVPYDHEAAAPRSAPPACRSALARPAGRWRLTSTSTLAVTRRPAAPLAAGQRDRRLPARGALCTRAAWRSCGASAACAAAAAD